MTACGPEGRIFVDRCEDCEAMSLILRRYCRACGGSRTAITETPGIGRVVAVTRVPEGRSGPEFHVGLVALPGDLTAMTRLPAGYGIGDEVVLHQEEPEGAIVMQASGES